MSKVSGLESVAKDICEGLWLPYRQWILLEADPGAERLWAFHCLGLKTKMFPNRILIGWLNGVCAYVRVCMRNWCKLGTRKVFCQSRYLDWT